MSLPLRSIPFAVLSFLSAAIGLAQPQPGSQTSDVERLRAATRHAEDGSLLRALRALIGLDDGRHLASWDPHAQLERVELLAHLRPRYNPDHDLENLVDAYASSPHAPYAHIRRGLAALQRGEHGRARIHFDHAVAASAEEDPARVDAAAAGTAYYWLGIAHLTDADGALAPQAAAALRVSADDYPRNPFADDATFALGQIAEERGELDTAIGYYRRILERYQRSDFRLEAALRAAQSHLRLNRIDDARSILTEVRSELDLPAADAERHALLAAEYHLLTAAAHEQARDYASAERSYLAVAYSPESPYRRSAMLGLADTYRAAGHPDSAIAIYTRLLREPLRDQPAMHAEYQLALAGVAHPYSAPSLDPLRDIATDSTHLLAPNARVTLAGIHYLRQEYALAEAFLDSSRDRLVSPSLAVRRHLLRGAIHLAGERYRDADNDLATALRLVRTTPLVLLPERDSIAQHVTLFGAIAMIHAGRPSEAVPQLNRLMETRPSNAAEAMYWLGEAYYAAGVLPAAVQTLEDLIETYPSSSRIEDALYAIGWAQFKQKKLDRAEAAFSRLVKAYPLTIYATAAHLRRGDCLYLMQKYVAAVDAYNLVDTSTAHADLVEYARYQSALAQYHAERRDAAGAAFARFVENHPASELADDALFMSGLVEYLERRYPRAVATLGALVDRHPTSPLVPRALATMAGAHYALAQFDSSRAVAARVVTAYPGSAYAAEADAALERADNAIRERDRQLARELERADESFARASRLRRDEDYDGAIEEYLRIVSRADDPAIIARAYRELGRTQLLAGDTSSAISSLHRASSRLDTDAGVGAAWDLADYYRARHYADSAVHYYRRVGSLADTSAPLAQLRIGQTYLGDERWTAALDAFNAVIASTGASPTLIGEANLGIASVHAGQGDRERAREMFQKLIRDHEGEEISRRAQEQLRTLGNL